MLRFTLFQPPSLRGGSLSLTFLAVALFLLGGRARGEDPGRDRAARVAVALAGEAKSAEDRDRTVRAALALAETSRPPVVAPAPRLKSCPCGACKCGDAKETAPRDALVRVSSGDGSGSGTVIWSTGQRSVVLTAAHVLTDGANHRVRGGGRWHDAQVLAVDTAVDLAALLVSVELPAVAVSAADPEPGTEVLMHGVTSLWSRGTIASVQGHMYLLDCATGVDDYSDSGDSGGGLFVKNELVGVHRGKVGPERAPCSAAAGPIRTFLKKVFRRDGSKTVPVEPAAEKPAPKAVPKAEEFDTWLINGQFIRVPKGTRPNFAAPSCPNGRCPLQR